MQVQTKRCEVVKDKYADSLRKMSEGEKRGEKNEQMAERVGIVCPWFKGYRLTQAVKHEPSAGRKEDY